MTEGASCGSRPTDGWREEVLMAVIHAGNISVTLGNRSKDVDLAPTRAEAIDPGAGRKLLK